MKNVLGTDGVINLDGKLGSKAEILKTDDPLFYESIEEGIRSTVKILIDNGFITYSSCQGHHSHDYSFRNVVVVLEQYEIDAWRAMIAELNILKKFKQPITYLVVDYRDNKKGLMVILGSVFDIKETEFKQKCFEESIISLKKCYYNKTFNAIMDFSAKCGHINIFN